MYRVSEETISAIEKIITGNGISANKQPVAPYKSGPDLVNFFNQFGFEDNYGDGFPSRWIYVEQRLKECNGKLILAAIIEKALDPRRFLGSDFPLEDSVGYLNDYLKLDGFTLRKNGELYRLASTQGLVRVSSPFHISGEPNQEFIEEQLKKCEYKISQRDYDGAITNARALLEAALLEVGRHLEQKHINYDGDLVRLYKRIQKLLNLDPSEKSISDSLKQVLSGLISIVNGLSSLRNKMGDAHARQYKPLSHHAKLAVNSARTIVDFIFETYQYQKSKKDSAVKINVEEALRGDMEDENCYYCSAGLVQVGDLCPACGEICMVG